MAQDEAVFTEAVPLERVQLWLKDLKDSAPTSRTNPTNAEFFRQRKLMSKYVYDMYSGNRQLALLDSEMQRQFPETHSEKPRQVENITKTIVDAISVVYKSPPDRRLSASETEEANLSDEAKKELQAEYDKITEESNLDMSFQKLERYLNFDCSDLIQIMFVDGKMKYKVWPQFLFDILKDDMGRVIAVALSDFDETSPSDIKNWIVWTDSNYWKFDKDLMLVENPNNPDNENPYGEIPFVFATYEEPDQGNYCESDIILAQTNLNINLLLSDMIDLADFQVHGQLVGLNVDMPENAKWGKEHMLMYRPENPDISSSIEFLKPDANFEGLLMTINRFLSGLSTSMGLPPNTFSMERQSAESGVALKIRSAPLIELRESMEVKFIDIEDQVRQKTIIVWNAHEADHVENNLPEDLEVTVQFNEADEAFESRTEMIQNTAMLKAQNLISWTEAVMAIHPNMKEEDARAHLEMIAEQKAEFDALFNPLPTGQIPEGEGGAQTPEDKATTIFDAALGNKPSNDKSSDNRSDKAEQRSNNQ